MNLLSEIIRRLNQRIGVANIFDKQFGLCELNANGNDKAWIHYIGDGQGEVVTNFDAKQGTIFWAKRGKVNINIIDSLKVSGCKKMYQTTFPLTAYAIVRKSHLPCDSEDAQDWIASRVYKLTSGMDFGFKASIGVTSYEVIPNGYANEIKSLTQNYEWACVSIDIDVQIVSSADDGCYDTCQTGEIPLPPNYEPCTPCLTEVAVDGVTITGNGTVADPLVAIGGGGGGSIRVQNEGTTLTNAATNLDFIGNAVNATLNAPGDVHININQVQSDWNAASGLGEILNKPTIPAAQVNSDWNAVSGVAEILNKPSIPAAQIQSDWTQANNAALDFIKNKPTIPAGTVTSVNSGININVDNTNPAVPVINSLADRYKTSSVTSNSVSNGSKSFAVDVNLSYIPLQEILVVFDPAHHMHGEVTSYNAATGALVVDIKTHTGSGTYTSWVLNLDGTPVDALTGSGTANEIAYFTAARVLASLPVATYPSLTELSYVKGVTSAIQTQINGKQNALGFTPENVANKSTDVATDQASNTKYPSVKAVFDWASSVFTTTAAVASQIATALAGYVANTRTLTINGNTQTLAADRTWTTIWKDTTTGTASSSNTNTVSKTQLIPAGTFGNDIIQLDWGTVNKTGAGGAVVYRVYVNGTADLVGSPQLIATYTASNVTSGARLERRLNIKSATVTEIPTATSLLTTDIGLNVLTSYNINWAVDKYFVFCVQNTNGLDSTAISYYRIIKT
jgi:hypothetical protein